MKVRLLSIILFLSVLGWAQDNSIKFRNLTIEDGLSQSSVNAILQDSYGFIWIGTQDGLNRYDGHNLKIYKHISNNPLSISNNFITALFESSTGDLWIGSEGGLDRFIPSTGEIYHYQNSTDINSISDNNITCINEDAEGDIWVGTKGSGINIIDSETGTIARIESGKTGLPSMSVNSIFRDHLDHMWVATLGGIAVFDENRKVKQFRHSPDCMNCLMNDAVWSINQDSSGFYWIGTSIGINKLYLEEGIPIFTPYEIKHEDLKGESVTISDILVDEKQAVWVGTSNGLYKLFEDQTGATKFYHFHNIHYSPASLIDNHVYCLRRDASGNIWVGTRNGVSRFDVLKQGFVHLKKDYDSDNTLIDNTIWCVYPESNDLFWIGTKGGLSYYNRVDNSFKNYSYPSSNPNRPNDLSVQYFYKDKEGTAWMGTVDGLFRLALDKKNNILSRTKVTYKNDRIGETDPVVYAVKEDSKGRFWIGTREGLSLYNRATGNYKFFRNNPKNENSLSNNIVRFIHEDGEGNVWLATHDGLNLVQVDGDSVSFKVYKGNPKTNQNLEGVILTTIWQNHPEYMWVGSYGNGFVRFNFKSKQFDFFDQNSHGLVNDAVYGIVGDKNDMLWISTNNGLSRFNIATEEIKNYDKKDGLQSNEFNTGAYCVTNSGEIVFGGINGLNFFRPENIHINHYAPKVLITSFLVDNESVMHDRSYLALPVLSHDVITLPFVRSKISIEFAALHFTNPENNQFKYILEGVDQDYIYTGSDYRANYTNLPPGEYTFKVYAANGDGVWSEQPATVKIIIETPYWRTTWFQLLMIALGLSITYGFYWMRVRDIRKQKIRLAKSVQEKTRKVLEQKEEIEKQKELIQSEKEKVEQLLLNILPEETAEELKSKGKASARQYRRVSVMFTDFKGFTQIAQELKPTELVAKLDSHFVQFDQIIEKYNLEKIKTIGDAYMCAGGLPVRNRENPIHTVLAALEIQSYMRKLREVAEKEDDDFWELRVGINTGATIAGVIGTKRFAYDIWGSTVNVASRLESACEPGRVNVSGTTFEFIEPYFDCSYRGKIPAKNAGEIDMYYVNRIKPELSEDEEGLVPNSTFWEYVNLHLFSSINYMKAERFIMRQLRKKLSPALHYHSIEHTIDVTEAAERIALLEGIKGEDLFILQTAATYHDAGFVEQYDNNEPVGARMAEEILPKYGYTEEQIDKISQLIHATKIPHSPNNNLEEIICDADLDYLGRDDFHEIADKLRRELREHGKINSDRLWDEIQIKFLEAHKYFTESAIKTRQAKKEQHIQEIKDRLARDEYKD